MLRISGNVTILFVCPLDCLGRNMQDLIDLVYNLNVQSIGFLSLQENLTMDRGNATGQLMFHLYAAFAEFEPNLIQLLGEWRLKCGGDLATVQRNMK